MIGDTIFTVVTVVYFICLVSRRRRIDRIVVEFLCTSVVSGVLVQMLDLMGLDWRLGGIRNFQTALLVVATGFVLLEKDQDVPARQGIARSMVLMGPSLMIGVAVVIARLTAAGQQSGVLTDLQFFHSEDDAKWLNVVSQMLTGAHVAVGNVGGVCVGFLAAVLSWSRVGLAILHFSTDDLAMVYSTVAVAQLALVVLVPLALSPMLVLVGRRFRGRELLLMSIVPAAFLASAAVRTMQLGHLSAELLLVIGSTLLSHACARRSDDKGQALSILILAAGCTSVWLPLQILPGVVSIGIVREIIMARKNGTLVEIRWSQRIFALLIVPGSLLISRNLLVYVTDTKSKITNLFSAGGAVQQFQSTTFLLMVILLATALLLKLELPDDSRFDPRPILLACGIVGALLAADYYRTGSSNYGTTKASFLIVAMSVPVLLLVVTAASTDRVSGIDTELRVLSVSLVLGLSFALDGSMFNVLDVARREQWKPQSSVVDDGWKRFTAVNGGSNQRLDELPIACGVAGTTPEILEVNDASYLCTRFLTAITGMESEAGPLVEWQLRRDWEMSLPYLAELPDEVRKRKIIVLSGEKVLGLENLTTYLELNGYRS